MVWHRNCFVIAMGHKMFFLLGGPFGNLGMLGCELYSCCLHLAHVQAQRTGVRESGTAAAAKLHLPCPPPPPLRTRKDATAQLGVYPRRDPAIKPRTSRPLSLAQAREGQEKHTEPADCQMAKSNTQYTEKAMKAV